MRERTSDFLSNSWGLRINLFYQRIREYYKHNFFFFFTKNASNNNVRRSTNIHYIGSVHTKYSGSILKNTCYTILHFH